MTEEEFDNIKVGDKFKLAERKESIYLRHGKIYTIKRWSDSYVYFEGIDNPYRNKILNGAFIPVDKSPHYEVY